MSSVLQAENPMILLAVPDLRGAEADYLAQCVTDNWVSSAGPFVVEFEERMAVITQRKFGVATVNGTSALQLAVENVCTSADDLVVVPDWTFAATANAVIHAGAQPLFVDVSEESWTLDPLSLEKAFEKYGKRIRAVIPVHALGHPADMDPILEVCGHYKVPIIEDAAGAIGATYKDRPVGSFGTAAIFSFNGNKTITAGGGGMIVSDNEEFVRRARHNSTQARLGNEYHHDAVGHNLRMTNVNAAIGVAQLERLDEMLAAKTQIAWTYDSAIKARRDLACMPRTQWAKSGCWLYSVRTNSEAESQSLVGALQSENIQARTFWRSLSAQSPYAHYDSLLDGVSESLSGRVVSLPCSSSLSEEDQGRVIAALGRWHGGK